VNGHAHNVTIPFTDLGTTASQTNYACSTESGHTHTIALSNQQFSDLKAGLQVKVTSTTTAGHAHECQIRGGSLLYESMCYNCHSDDKRGTRGMSSSALTSAQRDALQNPSGAAFSTATPPDPNVVPVPSGQPDGVTLYAANCTRCHGSLATSAKRRNSAATIKAAIASNRGGMGSLGGLSDAQIQAIATALQ